MDVKMPKLATSESNSKILVLLLVSSFYLTLGMDSFLAKFTQSDYKIKDIKAQIQYYNKHLLNTYKIDYFKPNRTTTAFNLTSNYKIEVGNQVLVTVQAYKFASNQFREFPLRFQINLCKAIHANVIGLLSAMKCGNLSKCYFQKEITYTFCNLVVDYSKLPPHIPNGLFNMQLNFTYENHHLSLVNTYGEIYRPFYSSVKSG